MSEIRNSSLQNQFFGKNIFYEDELNSLYRLDKRPQSKASFNINNTGTSKARRRQPNSDNSPISSDFEYQRKNTQFENELCFHKFDTFNLTTGRESSTEDEISMFHLKHRGRCKKDIFRKNTDPNETKIEVANLKMEKSKKVFKKEEPKGEPDFSMMTKREIYDFYSPLKHNNKK